MKTIEIHRYVLEDPQVLANGDKYDSRIIVKDDSGNQLARVPFVNTDSTSNYAGGRLMAGDYYAIKGPHGTGTTYPALWIFQTNNPGAIKSNTDVTDEMQILPSEISNPNHGGKKQIQYVHIHKGGLNWDWSHGCMTILTHELLKDNWTPFINLFAEGEVIRVRLVLG